MAPTPVVTCFLRNRGEVLLLRRSEAVGSYPGRWGAVSGHVARSGADPQSPERDPEAAARTEIDEETGLLSACELVRAGDPFAVADDEHGTWRVHPFMFDCDSRDVETNEETATAEWVSPTEILHRDTVPELWTSYDHVRPTIATVRDDREHGSTYLSVRALEILRDRAGELAVAGDPDADAWRDLADLAEDLVAARPGMAALRTRVDRAMATAEGRSAAAVESSAGAGIAAALDADAGAAATAAEHLCGTVLTLSRSWTVLAALRRAPVDEVVVAESRPGREGVDVAETLAADGLAITLIADAAVAHHLGEGSVDAVLVGGDTVLADGSVVNKVGTRGAALAAARAGVPLLVAAARDKIRDVPPDEVDLEAVDPAALYEGDADLGVASTLFDVTPGDLVDAVLTEDGALDAAAVRQDAVRHRELADWRS